MNAEKIRLSVIFGIYICLVFVLSACGKTVSEEVGSSQTESTVQKVEDQAGQMESEMLKTQSETTIPEEESTDGVSYVEAEAADTSSEQEKTEDRSGVLVVYFSHTGTTKRVSEYLHEWCGMFLFVCILLHLACNRKWFSRLFMGKYNCYRGFTTIIDMILIALIVLAAVSGMMISGYVFSFLQLGGTAWGKRMHLAGTAWLFLLSGIHFGMHMRNDKRNVLLYIVAACGIAAFAISRFYERLFLISEFAYVLSVSPWIIYLIHAFIFVTFVCIGNEIRLLVVKKNKM